MFISNLQVGGTAFHLVEQTGAEREQLRGVSYQE
jgi:hypothetical protein